jgi:2TM domain
MSTTPDELHVTAAKRVRERHDFAGHLVAFVVINLGMVTVWAVTGQGSFWPGWVLGAWGAGVALRAWGVFFRKPVTAADVEREAQRLSYRSDVASER